MNNKILLIDDYHIDECSGFHRVIHPGVKAEQPVLTADQPWGEQSLKKILYIACGTTVGYVMLNTMGNPACMQKAMME